jgi:small subunit ribosomal protein S15
MEKEKKQTVIEGYRTHEGDTGSPQVQVALLTERINSLTEHMKVHRHDYHSLRGLMMMVGQRQRLLKYLVKNDPESYRTITKKLGIRK